MEKQLDLIHKEAWGTFLVAHAALTRKLDKILQTEGYVSLLVYDVLLALEDAPEGRLRMSDLAEEVVFDPSSVTRLIDRLEACGLVAREAHPNDRRSIYAVITAKGLHERERCWPRYSALVQEFFGKYASDDEARTMRDVLMRSLGDHRRLVALGFKKSGS